MKNKIFSCLTTALAACFLMLFLEGCGKAKQVEKDSDKPISLNKTIGDLSTMYQYKAEPVIGIGIVAGLAGTGSSECPPEIRESLKKYIWQQMPKKVTMNPDTFIDSKNTAVVEILGVIPSLAGKGDHFDLKVKALERTQTISLEGGYLYTTDLTQNQAGLQGLGLYQKRLATGAGAVFIDTLSGRKQNPREGIVIGGGLVTEGVMISLALNNPNYYTASVTRNQINERFGTGTANAVSPGEIILTIPEHYKNDKRRFLAMILAMYLPESSKSQEQEVDSLVGQMLSKQNILQAELSLEAIGKPSLFSLSGALDSEDEQIRFHASRCMLNIGDDKGLPAMKAIAYDSGSKYRINAIESIGLRASRDLAIPVLNKLLGDDDIQVRLTAYDLLSRLEDISVIRRFIGRKFFVDAVLGGGKKVIYISRKDQPKIVLFSSPLSCEKNIFIESPDHTILINSRPDDPNITISRKHPLIARPVSLQTTRDLTEILTTLCSKLDNEDRFGSRQGLEVPYSTAVSLLKTMCQSNAIDAEFIAGPLSEAYKLK